VHPKLPAIVLGSHTDAYGYIWLSPLQLNSKVLRHEVAHILSSGREGGLRPGHDRHFRLALVHVTGRTEGYAAAERLAREFHKRKLAFD
jgi:predicted SprT family Zn-dependent metalloprotease